MRLVLGLVLISFFLVGCVAVEKKCEVDTDCLGKTCCHVKEAVNKKYAPDCLGKLCTSECVEGTTDCGYGKIQCVSGECKVVLK